MKRFLVCAVLSAVMFFMISCGGSDSNNNKDNGNRGNIEENNNGNGNTEENGNGENTEENNNDNGNTEENGNGENTEENNNDNGNTEDNSGCTKITPKWTGVDDEEIYDEIVIYGSYTPQTGTNPDYGDTIYFYVEYEDDPKNEYDFASTIDAGVQVLEGLRESDYEETGHDNEWDRAYIAVSGKVQINNFDAENKHFSVSLQNVKLMEATLNREDEDGTWTMVKDGACLVIESSSFEQ